MRPPRWAEWLLERALPKGIAGSAILGDMAEEFESRCEAFGARQARRWYVRQTLGVVLRARPLRAAGLPNREPSGPGHFVDTLRGAIRSLRRAPAFTAATCTVLALGIASTTAVFSIVDTVLLRPLPYNESDRLVSVLSSTSDIEIPLVSEPEFHDLQNQIQSFAAVGVHQWEGAAFDVGDEPQRIAVVRASASLYDVLGVAPVFGRWFGPDDDRPGSDPTLVLSNGLWMTAFGGSPNAIGAVAIVNDVPHQVIGVMPPGFNFPVEGAQAWAPLRLDPADPFARNNQYLRATARLRGDVSLASATAEVEALAAASLRAHPEFYADRFDLRIAPLKEQIVGTARGPLLLLLGAVGMLLLVSATNAAGLFLARGEDRRTELAVRAALGAPRRTIAAQLLAESVLVALLAGVVGLVFANWVVAGLGAAGAPEIPRLSEVAVDRRIALFGISVALLTGLVFGLLPAVQAGRGDVRAALAASGRGRLGSRSSARFKRGLIVGQLALASFLVLGSTLMFRSLGALRTTDLGFDPSGTLVIPLEPTNAALERDEAAVRFYAALGEQVAALPTVTAVGVARRVPLVNGHDRFSLQIEGREAGTVAEAPVAGIQWASHGYFDAARIALLQGRALTAQDHATNPLVTVINEQLAAELWPNGDALGARVRMWPEGSPWMEVVGVVADVRSAGPAESCARPWLYVPHAQGFLSGYISPERHGALRSKHRRPGRVGRPDPHIDP